MAVIDIFGIQMEVCVCLCVEVLAEELAQSLPIKAAALGVRRSLQCPHTLESSSFKLALGNGVEISLKNSSSFSIL